MLFSAPPKIVSLLVEDRYVCTTNQPAYNFAPQYPQTLCQHAFRVEILIYSSYLYGALLVGFGCAMLRIVRKNPPFQPLWEILFPRTQLLASIQQSRVF